MHTITVTAVPTDESDDVEWVVGGTHEQTCDVWWECFNAAHRHPSEEYGWENEYWHTKRVPELHLWIYGGVGWAVRGKNPACGYDEADHGELYFDLIKAEAKIGDTYVVDVSWDGDYWEVLLGAKVIT